MAATRILFSCHWQMYFAGEPTTLVRILLNVLFIHGERKPLSVLINLFYLFRFKSKYCLEKGNVQLGMTSPGMIDGSIGKVQLRLHRISSLLSSPEVP